MSGSSNLHAVPWNASGSSRRVVLVAEEHDRDERVGTQERGALAEELDVDVIGRPVAGRVAVAHDLGPGIGLHEEAVDALELRLEPAAVLPDADDEILERGRRAASRLPVAGTGGSG